MVHGDDVGRNDLRCQADILGTNEEWFRPFCFTSTEARMLITRDGDKEGRGRKSEGSTADTARERPEIPWTAARTMEVLSRCPALHCPATSALPNCCFNYHAWAESLRQCPLHCC